LNVDYRTLCPALHHRGFFAFAIVYSVCFLIGLPMAFIGLLWYYRVPHMAREKERACLERTFLKCMVADANAMGCDVRIDSRTRLHEQTMEALDGIVHMPEVKREQPQRRGSVAARYRRTSGLHELLDRITTAPSGPPGGSDVFQLADKALLISRAEQKMLEMVRAEQLNIPRVAWGDEPSADEQRVIARLGILLLAYEPAYWWCFPNPYRPPLHRSKAAGHTRPASTMRRHCTRRYYCCLFRAANT
jgi:hypothetical protein